MKRKFFYLIIFVLLGMYSAYICGCGISQTNKVTPSTSLTPTPVSAPTEDKAARAVLEKHFKYLSEKSEEGAKTTISEDKRINMTFQTDRMDYIKVISISYESSDTVRKQYLVNGRGAANCTLPENLQVFMVTYEIKYHTAASQESGTYTEAYFLIRKNANGSWLIDDWGHI